MKCPHCQHAMTDTGCCKHTGLHYWWCNNCGAAKPCEAPAVPSVLFGLCRKLVNTMYAGGDYLDALDQIAAIVAPQEGATP